MTSLGVESVQFFESYQLRAMERVFAAAKVAGSSADSGVIPGSNGGGTIHGLLGHTVDGDIHWLNRWLGNERSTPQMPGAWATISEVEAAWRADFSRRADFFASLDETELQREYGFYRGKPPTYDRRLMWKSILHVHNHATHHRAEVCALLTTVGFPPESVDMIDYLRSN